MSDEKEKAKSWLFNSNNVLIALVIGTVVATQNPFHQTRPDVKKIVKEQRHLVDAQPWQDPFEAINTYITNQKNNSSADTNINAKSLNNLQNQIINNSFNEI